MASKEERIRTRAYELWEQGGSRHGQHHEHWEQASREVTDDSDGNTPAPADAAPSRNTEPKPDRTVSQNPAAPAQTKTVSVRETVTTRSTASESASRKPG